MRHAKHPGLNELIQAAVDQGWRHEMSGGSHHRLIPPDKTKPILVTGSTPSDHRAILNFRSSLRRHGVEV